MQPEHHLKDFGVWLSADSTRTYHIAGKANRIAGCICILSVYIHPILEYCCLHSSTGERPASFLKKELWDERADLLGAVGNTELNFPSDATPSYELLHVSKIYHGLVPNCVGMEFQTGPLGIQVKTQK